MQRRSLLDRPFGTLPVLSVWAHPGHFLIPDGLGGLDGVILLLDEICYSYQDDLAENRHLLQSTPPPGIDEFPRYVRREKWRIGSFIVFAWNLEQTLKRRHKELLNFVRKLQPDFDAVSDDPVKRREAEIRGYKEVRHKIFAHTAFGAPRNDNLSMQATSLMWLETIACRITPEGIGLGGMTVTVGEQDPPNFEPLTFPKMVSDFGRHFLEWRKMFGKLCSILRGSTDDEIKQAIGGEVNIDIIERVGDADDDAS